MSRSTQRILFAAAIFVAAVLVVVANVARSHSQVRGIEVDIHYGSVPQLVDSQTVIDTIFAILPTLSLQRVADVDCPAVAEAAARVPALRDVSATTSVSGKVVVRARQRRPVARLYYGAHELYFDSEGCLFPTSQRASADVLVVGGDFVEPLRTDTIPAQLQALVQVASFLDENSDYSPLIDQAYILANGDIMLTPKLGDHVIELGTATNLTDKFDALLAFYRHGMPRAGWNTYSKLSLKFKNQIVCTKKPQNI